MYLPPYRRLDLLLKESMYEHQRETELALRKKLLERSLEDSIFYPELIESPPYELQDPRPTVGDTTREWDVVYVVHIVLKKRQN